MKIRLKAFCMLMVLANTLLMGQNDTCKVFVKAIAGNYKGDCLNGMANGKGASKGIDTYTGYFVNGFPDGKGKYEFENGNVFTGYWRKGLKNGQGKFIYFIAGKKNVQEGFWKEDNYIGRSDPDDFYKITNHSGTEHFEIKKVNDNQVKIKISFYSAMSRYIPDNINITTTTGQSAEENKGFSIYNYFTPNLCEISYVIKTSGGDKICKISFEILKLGNYEVMITND